MKKIFLIMILGLAAVFTYAQKETPQDLLKRASDKMASYKTISANFTYMLNNTSANLNDSQTGKLMIKGNKYILELGRQVIMSDGQTVYTILADAEEIQVNNIEDMGDMLSPDKIFTEYYRKYNAKTAASKTVGGVACHVIDLDTGKDKDFSKAALTIAKADLSPKEFQLTDNKGTVHTFKLTDFASNKEIEDVKFSFNKDKYPGFEIIDMR